MGHGGPLLRLEDPFLSSSFSLDGSDSPSQLFPVVHQGNRIKHRRDRLDCEGSRRTCSFDSRLLQLTVCYPQGHRGLALGYRSLAFQLLGACLSFSHGDSTVGAPVFSFGGLDGVPGSPGRLPPGFGAPIFSALSEVLRMGFGAPIPHALLRPVHCSASVHAGHGPYIFSLAPIWVPNFALSGRLTCPWILEGLSSLALSGAWRSRQPCQELPRHLSDFGLSGDETPDTSFEGFPNPRTCPESLLSASFLIPPRCPGTSLSVRIFVGGPKSPICS